MKKDLSITQEAFDVFLTWLAPSREDAGRKYEAIRLRLIKMFTCRGCNEAEELADETINRVASKASNLVDKYVGDPMSYFYGVAHKVYLEYLRKKHEPIELPPANPTDEVEMQYDCLERCLKQLPAVQSQLILQYYQDSRRAKIDHRKELAKTLSIAPNALRIRAHRIRGTLHQCVQECLKQKALS